MQASERSKTWKALEQAFGGALSRPFTEACRLAWRVAVSDEQVHPPDDSNSTVYFRFTLSGSVDGDVFLVMRHSDTMSLGFREAPEQADQFGEQHYKALLSTLNRCTGELQEALNELGVTSVRIESCGAPSMSIENAVALTAQGDDPNRKATLYLVFDERVIASLQVASAKAFNYPAATEPSGGNLDLVMDVALNVTLRFGQRRLSLREVLDLTSGSVVELDRQVDEPVELVLDGKVVARGEAVIIDGNYGLRVTQVLPTVVA